MKTCYNQKKNFVILALMKRSGGLVLRVPPHTPKMLPKVFSELTSELTEDWEKSHPG